MLCRKPFFVASEGIYVPCGHCPADRMAKASEWCLRMTYELEKTKVAVFISLTYEDSQSLGIVHKPDLQRYVKRLRKRYASKKLTYYACGEYGNKTGRPHYHLIVFGLQAADFPVGFNYVVGKSNPVSPDWDASSEHRSALGFTVIKDVLPRHIRYVAGYIRKKLGTQPEWNAARRAPPFSVSSQRLGLDYVLSHSERIKKELTCTVDGVKHGLPRYYREQLNISRASIVARAEAEEAKLYEFFRKEIGDAPADVYDKSRWLLELAMQQRVLRGLDCGISFPALKNMYHRYVCKKETSFSFDENIDKLTRFFTAHCWSLKTSLDEMWDVFQKQCASRVTFNSELFASQRGERSGL